MKNTQRLAQWPVGLFAATLALFLFTGCESTTSSNGVSAAQPAPAPTPVVTPAAQPAAAAAPAAAPAPAAASAPAAATAPAQVTLPLRIKAGSTEGFTDKDGNKWLPEQGFTDGDSADRPDITVTAPDDQRIYKSEHYSMTKFEQPLPNGHYTVKLHFCETFDGITGTGQRVFSFNVQGKDFKDLDVWAKAGGFEKAYIETVPVDVTNGKLTVTFTPNVENPEINGIEILPNP